MSHCLSRTLRKVKAREGAYCMYTSNIFSSNLQSWDLVRLSHRNGPLIENLRSTAFCFVYDELPGLFAC